MRIAILMLLVASSAAAEEQQYTCPADVPEMAVEVTRAPEGWAGLVSGRFVLSSAAITLEHPAQRMVQIGDMRKLDKKRFRVDYLHLKDWQGEKWLVCQYGGSVELARRLPDETQSCSMLYTPQEPAPHKIEITCR